MADQSVERALLFIAHCTAATHLRKVSENALRLGQKEVHQAAELRLYKVLPSDEPGTLGHDVWQSIHALEGTLKLERGKTTLLARTRQKINRDGERKTVSDLIRSKASDGFQMLKERDMLQLSFEAVALRHAQEFEADVIEAADARLREAGFDPANMT